jgi:hypothetical protein
MFGWVGELASAFASGGLAGLVLLALLIIIALLLRQVAISHKLIAKMHDGMINALDNSSEAHRGVTRVLGRIEGILGLGGED